MIINKAGISDIDYANRVASIIGEIRDVNEPKTVNQSRVKMKLWWILQQQLKAWVEDTGYIEVTDADAKQALDKSALYSNLSQDYVQYMNSKYGKGSTQDE